VLNRNNSVVAIDDIIDDALGLAGLPEPVTDAERVYIGDDVVTFLETEMYLADTGKPMELHDEQKRVLREMFRRDERGFVYSTMLYSSIKKSAKTTIFAGVALWQAFRVAHGEVYIIGNDQKQADSRMAQSIRECIRLNPRMAGIKLPVSTYRINLPNGTRIETIPVDPSGEAGMNPTGLFWTEAWGAKGKAHELLWTEAQLSPTRMHNSFKCIESYAGHSGESLMLERLYDAVIKDGTPLPDVAPELFASGSMIGYWNTRRYLSWQTPEYYAEQERTLLPKEYRRIHCNEWGTSEDAFVDAAWWDACQEVLPLLEARTPQILSLDAGVSSDNFAIVSTTKHGERYAQRLLKLFEPPTGGKLEFTGPNSPDEFLRQYVKDFNVLEVCYDPYQLHSLMTQYRRERVVRVREFSQGTDRLLADKAYRDAIMDKSVMHDGDMRLRSHVLNANAKTEGSDSRLRLVKRSERLKIDAAVCASMGLYRARQVRM
jgi:hypothetical protein